VLSIERFEDLAAGARERLAALEPAGDGRVEIRVGDGTLGAADRAPFEAIAVHASAPAPPPSLLDQLAPGGRMVLPVAEQRADVLMVLTTTEAGLVQRVIAPCRFVPLVGEQGFSDRGA
jgi:protein-L-isoaspartate(D-aspartate) O-methyltransferase